MYGYYLFYGICIIVGLVVAALLICFLYSFLRFYVFGRLLQSKVTIKARVAGKMLNPLDVKPGNPVDKVDFSDYRYGYGYSYTAEAGCLTFLFGLVAAIPWKGIVNGGLDDPYIIYFDAMGDRKIALKVSIEAFKQFDNGQEGYLTYKGNQFIKFISSDNMTHITAS